jgi:predicted MFS family arabinose efflux permease
MLIGVGGSLPAILLARLMAGGFKQSLSMCKAFTCDAFAPKHRTIAFGWHYTSSSLGFSLGPSISGMLAASHGIILPAMLSCLVFCINIAFVALCLPGREHTYPTAAKAPLKQQPLRESAREVNSQPKASEVSPKRTSVLAANSHVQLLLLLRLMVTFSIELLRSAFPLILQLKLAATITTTGHINSYMSVVGVICQTMVIAPLTVRLDDEVLVMWSLVALGCSQILVGLASDFPTLALALTGCTVAQSIIRTVMGTLISKSADPVRLGEILGLADSSMAVSRAAAPTVAGMLVSWVGMSTPLLLAAGLSLAAAMTCCARLVGASTNLSQHKTVEQAKRS